MGQPQRGQPGQQPHHKPRICHWLPESTLLLCRPWRAVEACHVQSFGHQRLDKVSLYDLCCSGAGHSTRCQTPLKGHYEVCVDDMPQPELRGEEWRQMLCPMLGQEIPGRTVSSLGRLRTQTGRIHSGCLRSGYLANAAANLEYVTPTRPLFGKQAGSAEGQMQVRLQACLEPSAQEQRRVDMVSINLDCCRGVGIEKLHPRKAAADWWLRVPGCRCLPVTSGRGVEGRGLGGACGRQEEASKGPVKGSPIHYSTVSPAHCLRWHPGD